MPIDIATGNVELDREDFSLPGRVPIKWVRSYRTSLLDQVPGDNNVRPILLLFVTGDVQITRGYPIDVALLDHLEQFGIHIMH